MCSFPALSGEFASVDVSDVLGMVSFFTHHLLLLLFAGSDSHLACNGKKDIKYILLDIICIMLWHAHHGDIRLFCYFMFLNIMEI